MTRALTFCAVIELINASRTVFEVAITPPRCWDALSRARTCDLVEGTIVVMGGRRRVGFTKGGGVTREGGVTKGGG